MSVLEAQNKLRPMVKKLWEELLDYLLHPIEHGLGFPRPGHIRDSLSSQHYHKGVPTLGSQTVFCEQA